MTTVMREPPGQQQQSSAASAKVIVEADGAHGTRLRYQPSAGHEAALARQQQVVEQRDPAQADYQGSLQQDEVVVAQDNARTQELLSESERVRRQRQAMPRDLQQPETPVEDSRATSSGDLDDDPAQAAVPSDDDGLPWSVELFPWGPALTVRDGILGFGLHQDHFPDGVAEIANVSGGFYRMQFEGDASGILVDGQPLDPDRPEVVLDGDGRTITFAEPVGVVLTPIDEADIDVIEAPADSG